MVKNSPNFAGIFAFDSAIGCIMTQDVSRCSLQRIRPRTLSVHYFTCHIQAFYLKKLVCSAIGLVRMLTCSNLQAIS